MVRLLARGMRACRGRGHLGRQIILRQPPPQHLKRLFRRIGKLEQIDVLRRNCAGIHQNVQVENLLPVL